MHIKHIEIGNFRKLKAVRIDFSTETTIFVGANNSGKTSAMEALRWFLIEPNNKTKFSINDFTLSHWKQINSAAENLEYATRSEAPELIKWDCFAPFLDVWLDVPEKELHYVQKILPTLDWDGSSIGVRLRFEPKDAEELQNEYLEAKRAANGLLKEMANGEKTESSNDTSTFTLWPRSMMDFLVRRMRSTFEVRAYLLDPAKLENPENGNACPQHLPENSDPIDGDPFKGLIRIDEISAQRGFGLAGSASESSGDGSREDIVEPRTGKKLSSQLRKYYDQHLEPSDAPPVFQDIGALCAMHEAQMVFEKQLKKCFSHALAELENIGYPGVTDPKLTITTDMRLIDGLNHRSTVKYEVPMNSSKAGDAHHLPEDSNGLGYQNLVSIVFSLMSFRDKWMKVGKAKKSKPPEDALIPPLHLVLIEEPEAHLHAQVQQVFIQQAYGVLRKHDKLNDSTDLRTQLVVSTHSSHIAHEADFASLRYFRRLPVPTEVGAVSLTAVVNLSEIFSGQDEAKRFVKRYLRATHCDLFFADGAILVEGSAERILLPHLVREQKKYEYLKQCYITWLEIGGSHVHKFRSLIEHLGLNTLIITDIDAKDDGNSRVVPKRKAEQTTRNATLAEWIPKDASIDNLLDKKSGDKSHSDRNGYAVRVAYQTPISMKFGSETEALANTFEDALVYENCELFKTLPGHGLIKKFRDALTSSTEGTQLEEKVFEALGGGSKKAEFALDILSSDAIDQLKVPAYIDEGLLWLVDKLKRKEEDVVGTGGAEI
ncbi:ATP-dependent nuclease [Verminephrobacter aporrectodeae]|uniref:ATP-dependent nuclease n=1 Tax=Verminephrobacter aporrectodeae TaxID=1110389 RepID=UPI00224428A4|nr:AAA family ATPase [Verminephrobacter aporrectodeae]MCW8176113.1 DUF2813 domain-containing protein [Verminephrobacter aporrectodeae subsp. tuberculatae]MCW8203076.1 DUF2813 domain-containing protein [Verminephrobacter aporrectodeae subsp. tuberculatae]